MSVLRLLAVVLIVPLLGACAGRIASPAQCALMGAVAGGLGGAGAGYEIDGDNQERNAGIGAPIGAIVGAGAGYLICSLMPEAKPAPPPPPPAPPPRQARPAPPPPPPPAQKERIVLRGVNFAFDKAQIDPASAVVLDVAAQTLRENRGVRVRVEGHTDSVGAEDYNARLSEQRAGAVRDYLVQKGVAASRLSSGGYGESRPVASNDSADGRRLNRRVELVTQD